LEASQFTVTSAPHVTFTANDTNLTRKTGSIFTRSTTYVYGLAGEMMNFDATPVEIVTREFVAVILAGFGNE
jgi:hypothetical protein